MEQVIQLPQHPVDVFLGRQPIIDRRRRVIAYELLHRSGAANEAAVADDALATAQVIQGAFGRMGIDTVLGRCEGFINVDAETLLGRRVEQLPSERVVLELLETMQVDERIVRRCRELRARGFRIALDDFFRFDPRYEPLLEIADIVKIDLLQVERGRLPELVRRLRLYPARLLAEKVESREAARQCLRLGFDLFQGFFIARPALLSTAA